MSALPKVDRKALAEDLEILAGDGITLKLVGGKLQVSAPIGLLTDTDRAFIKQNKAAIIRHLNGESETYTL